MILIAIIAIFRWGYKPTYNWGGPSSADLHHNPFAPYIGKFTNICSKNHPNVAKPTIHGA